MTTVTIDNCSREVPARKGSGDPRASGWAERLVTHSEGDSYGELCRRAAAGLGLSALYGLALGARQGGKALASHAVGVPLGLLIVVVAAAPSLFVFLSIWRTGVDAQALASTTARGLGNAGLLLAGLAPAAALFVVSSETPRAAAGAVWLGLVLGGGVPLGRATWEILRSAVTTRAGATLGGMAVALGFAVFSSVLAMRVWSAVLPILAGAS